MSRSEEASNEGTGILELDLFIDYGQELARTHGRKILSHIECIVELDQPLPSDVPLGLSLGGQL